MGMARNRKKGKARRLVTVTTARSALALAAARRRSLAFSRKELAFSPSGWAPIPASLGFLLDPSASAFAPGASPAPLPC